MKKEHLAVISQSLGVEPVFINSALVCAQNRQRYYWCNWDVPQPEDRGIVLADIIEHEPTNPTVMTDTFCKRNADILRDDVTGKARNLSAMEYVKNGRQGDYIKVGRKINPTTGKRDDYNSDLVAEQRFEARPDDKCGTLTTVQKDNILQIVDRDKSRALTTSCGKSNNPKLYKEGRKGNLVFVAGIRYRKLTVVECCRLQGVPDDYFKVSSNTQAYKMLGNGWQCDTIEHIFEHCPAIYK